MSEDGMRNLLRSTWILALLIALCAALAGATLRAAAQSVMTGQRTPATPAGAIHDDPTVAPDKRQSADNNVSFPVDI